MCTARSSKWCGVARCDALGITRGRPNFGKQCARSAVTGSKFCVMHGGKDDTTTPSAVRKRRDRGGVRCVRTKRDGEQCKNYALPGGTLCRKHGGNAPHIQRAARERFNDMIDPMINITARMAEDALSGKMSHADQLRLVTFIADRTGFGQKAEVEVQVKTWEKTLEGIMKTPPPELRQNLPELEAVVLDDDSARDEDEPDTVPGPVEWAESPRVIGSANPPRDMRW